MSKDNPNQDYYKIGGRTQSDGPDRKRNNPAAGRDDDAEPRTGSEKLQGKEGQPNFIPGEAPVGEKKKD